MISLDQMSMLARKLKEADAKVKDAEAEGKRLKESARILREETIPSAMQELGVVMLKLDTGETLTIKQDVYASIPKADKPRAFAWLEEHGFGGLIKTVVGIQYGKGQLEDALALEMDLRSQGLDAGTKRDVHAQTFKAFLREQIAAGTDLPLDLFGARPVWTAQLK